MSLSHLFHNLREYTIGKNGIETANLLTPSKTIAAIRKCEENQLEFAEFMESEQDYKRLGLELKSVLENVYGDTIDGFEGVKVSNGEIKGFFFSNLSPTLVKKFQFTASPQGIYFELINANEINNANVSFQEAGLYANDVVDFATAAGDKKKRVIKNCSEGSKTCHGADGKTKYCINKNFKCATERKATPAERKSRTVKPSPEDAAKLEKIVQRGEVAAEKFTKARVSKDKLAKLDQQLRDELSTGGEVDVLKLQRKLKYPATTYGNDPLNNPVNRLLADMRTKGELEANESGDKVKLSKSDKSSETINSKTAKNQESAKGSDKIADTGKTKGKAVLESKSKTIKEAEIAHKKISDDIAAKTRKFGIDEIFKDDYLFNPTGMEVLIRKDAKFIPAKVVSLQTSYKDNLNKATPTGRLVVETQDGTRALRMSNGILDSKKVSADDLKEMNALAKQQSEAMVTLKKSDEDYYYTKNLNALDTLKTQQVELLDKIAAAKTPAERRSLNKELQATRKEMDALKAGDNKKEEWRKQSEQSYDKAFNGEKFSYDTKEGKIIAKYVQGRDGVNYLKMYKDDSDNPFQSPIMNRSELSNFIDGLHNPKIQDASGFNSTPVFDKKGTRKEMEDLKVGGDRGGEGKEVAKKVPQSEKSYEQIAQEREGADLTYRQAKDAPKGGAVNQNYGNSQATIADALNRKVFGVGNGEKIYNWAKKHDVDLFKLQMDANNDFSISTDGKRSADNRALMDAVVMGKPFKKTAPTVKTKPEPEPEPVAETKPRKVGNSEVGSVYDGDKRLEHHVSINGKSEHLFSVLGKDKYGEFKDQLAELQKKNNYDLSKYEPELDKLVDGFIADKQNPEPVVRGTADTSKAGVPTYTRDRTPAEVDEYNQHLDKVAKGLRAVKGEVSIPVSEWGKGVSTKTVPATIYGGTGLAFTTNNFTYTSPSSGKTEEFVTKTLTHVPTGMKILDVSSEKQARKLVALLAESGVDLTSPDLNKDGDTLSKLVKIIKGSGVTPQTGIPKKLNAPDSWGSSTASKPTPDVTKDSVKQTTRATPKPDVSEASPSKDEIKQKQSDVLEKYSAKTKKPDSVRELIDSLDLGTGKANEAKSFLKRNLENKIERKSITEEDFNNAFSNSSNFIPEADRKAVKEQFIKGFSDIGVSIVKSAMSDKQVKLSDAKALIVQANNLRELGNSSEAEKLESEAKRLRTEARQVQEPEKKTKPTTNEDRNKEIKVADKETKPTTTEDIKKAKVVADLELQKLQDESNISNFQDQIAKLDGELKEVQESKRNSYTEKGLNKRKLNKKEKIADILEKKEFFKTATESANKRLAKIADDLDNTPKEAKDAYNSLYRSIDPTAIKSFENLAEAGNRFGMLIDRMGGDYVIRRQPAGSNIYVQPTTLGSDLTRATNRLNEELARDKFIKSLNTSPDIKVSVAGGDYVVEDKRTGKKDRYSHYKDFEDIENAVNTLKKQQSRQDSTISNVKGLEERNKQKLAKSSTSEARSLVTNLTNARETLKELGNYKRDKDGSWYSPDYEDFKQDKEYSDDIKSAQNEIKDTYTRLLPSTKIKGLQPDLLGGDMTAIISLPGGGTEVWNTSKVKPAKDVPSLQDKESGLYVYPTLPGQEGKVESKQESKGKSEPAAKTETKPNKKLSDFQTKLSAAKPSEQSDMYFEAKKEISDYDDRLANPKKSIMKRGNKYFLTDGQGDPIGEGYRTQKEAVALEIEATNQKRDEAIDKMKEAYKAVQPSTDLGKISREFRDSRDNQGNFIGEIKFPNGKVEKVPATTAAPTARLGEDLPYHEDTVMERFIYPRFPAKSKPDKEEEMMAGASNSAASPRSGGL